MKSKRVSSSTHNAGSVGYQRVFFVEERGVSVFVSLDMNDITKINPGIQKRKGEGYGRMLKKEDTESIETLICLRIK
jgi:hypothetical protein